MIDFVISIVGNLLSAYIWESVRGKDGTTSAPVSVPTKEQAHVQPSADYVSDARAENRRRVRMRFSSLAHRFASLYSVYLGFAGPLIVLAMLPNKSIMLSDARLIGGFLPDISVGEHWFQASLLVPALLLYIPISYIVSRVLGRWGTTLDRYYSYTEIEGRVSLLLYMVLSAAVASLTTYLYSSLTLAQSLKAVGIGILVIGFFGSQSVASARR